MSSVSASTGRVPEEATTGSGVPEVRSSGYNNSLSQSPAAVKSQNAETSKKAGEYALELNQFGNESATETNRLVERKKGKRYALVGRTEDGTGVYVSNFGENETRDEKIKQLVNQWQQIWNKQPIELEIDRNGEKQKIIAQFNPDYDPDNIRMTDLGKVVHNKNGLSGDRTITLNLAHDLRNIASEAHYLESEAESGKKSDTHNGVKEWHYFTSDFIYRDKNGDKPMRLNLDIKEKADGEWVYQIYSKKAKKEEASFTDSRKSAGNRSEKTSPSESSIAQSPAAVKSQNAETSKKAGEYALELNQFGNESATETDRLVERKKGKQYAIELDESNYPMVKADRNFTLSDDKKQWGKQIRQYIRDEIRKHGELKIKTLDGDEIILDNKSQEKARDWLANANDQNNRVRKNASAHLDEVVAVSEDKAHGEPNHPDEKGLHPWSKDGWRYREAVFEDYDGRRYLLELSVGVNGENQTVYNIGQVDEIQKKNQTPVNARQGRVPSEPARTETALPHRRLGSSESNITHDAAAVKNQNAETAKKETQRTGERQNTPHSIRAASLSQEAQAYSTRQSRFTAVGTLDTSKEMQPTVGRQSAPHSSLAASLSESSIAQSPADVKN